MSSQFRYVLQATLKLIICGYLRIPLSSLAHLGLCKATSIQTFDFSTLYFSIPHDLLKSRMNNIINNAFKHRDGATRYTHIKVGRNKSYFTIKALTCDKKYSASDICK